MLLKKILLGFSLGFLLLAFRLTPVTVPDTAASTRMEQRNSLDCPPIANLTATVQSNGTAALIAWDLVTGVTQYNVQVTDATNSVVVYSNTVVGPVLVANLTPGHCYEACVSYDCPTARPAPTCTNFQIGYVIIEEVVFREGQCPCLNSTGMAISPEGGKYKFANPVGNGSKECFRVKIKKKDGTELVFTFTKPASSDPNNNRFKVAQCKPQSPNNPGAATITTSPGQVNVLHFPNGLGSLTFSSDGFSINALPANETTVSVEKIPCVSCN